MESKHYNDPPPVEERVGLSQVDRKGLEIWKEQAKGGELKEAINLFIWRWGHPALTLAEAEEIACRMFDALIEAPRGAK